MKRLMINIAMLALLAGTFSSCKKTLDNEYLNPDVPSSATIPNLFTGMMLNNRIHSSYYDYYTFIMTVTAPFSQMCAISPGNQMYIPNANYTQSRWNDFYTGSISSTSGTPDYRYSGPGIMSNYTQMLTNYAALDAADQQTQYIFLQAGKVLMCDQAAQMVDLWGDIPFFNTNSLQVSGTVVNAPFDNAATIYDSLISYLDQLNTYFGSVTLSQNAATIFASQDLIYGGNISNWQRYTNSLRLRLLMRISNVNESTAQTAVTAMLNNPSHYPLLNDNSYNAQFNQNPNTLISDIQGALGQGPNPLAPAYLLDTLMVANGDPRLPVFFDPNANGQYAGFPWNGTAAQYSDGLSNQSISPYDSATFQYNYNVPGILFNAAETDFLVAEADARWNLGDGGSSEYYAGIAQSIAFYYNINQTNVLKSGSWARLASPTAAAIAAYEAMPAIAYTGSQAQLLAKIYTQKWEHFFILQAGQAWAEYRRTGYPQLQFYNNTSSSVAATPPQRILYPQEEALYNPTNYATVAAQDTYNTKIFWDVN